jgi:hypothetical protein
MAVLFTTAMTRRPGSRRSSAAAEGTAVVVVAQTFIAARFFSALPAPDSRPCRSASSPRRGRSARPAALSLLLAFGALAGARLIFGRQN